MNNNDSKDKTGTTDAFRAEVVQMFEANNPVIDKYDIFKYPDIKPGKMDSVQKKVDNNIIRDTVAVIIDPTVFGDLSCAYVFTTTGLYCKELFRDAQYINYSDISSIDCGECETGLTSFYKYWIEITSEIIPETGSEVKIRIESDHLDMPRMTRLLYLLCAWQRTQGINMSLRESGDVKEDCLDDKTKNKCHAIIHTASTACAAVGGGLAQAPCSDALIITPIQIGMVMSLAAVFGMSLTREAARSVVKGFAAAIVGRSISQWLLGWMPGIGNAINLATAAGITEAIGWSSVKAFQNEYLENKIKFAYEGQRQGYKHASYEYEQKLRAQANLFKNETDKVKKEHAAYESLLKDWEDYIANLASQSDLSAGDVNALEKIKSEFDELKSLDSTTTEA